LKWLNTIEAVESSMKIMRSNAPGSRRYIEHMRPFMTKALANMKPEDNDSIESTTARKQNKTGARFGPAPLDKGTR
jgi:hypothetical protein